MFIQRKISIGNAVRGELPTFIWVVTNLLYHRCAFAAMVTSACSAFFAVCLLSPLVLLLGKSPAATNFTAHHVALYFASATFFNCEFMSFNFLFFLNVTS